MGMNTSEQAILDMASIMKITSNNIDKIKNSIKNNFSNNNWSDSKGAEFKNIMDGISSSIDAPKKTLEDAEKNLRKLAGIVAEYNKLGFNK